MHHPALNAQSVLLPNGKAYYLAVSNTKLAKFNKPKSAAQIIAPIIKHTPNTVNVLFISCVLVGQITFLSSFLTSFANLMRGTTSQIPEDESLLG
jgi:hypothetical protein